MLDGKRAYICSPLSDKCEKRQIHNMEMARFYMGRMSKLYHCRTFASHAYLPLMLNDQIPEERELALSIGKQLMEICGVLIMCVNVAAQQNPNINSATARTSAGDLSTAMIAHTTAPHMHRHVFGSYGKLKYSAPPNAIKNGTHRNALTD